ncbi:MAG: dephospho-CoA kinase [Tepidisphaeraceae bacterium]
MFGGKPIIGILGGIGSGKSFVSACFGELGACVINADELVHQAYADDAVKAVLKDWWGDAVFHADGTVNRRAIAAKVFTDSAERERLEQLVHPKVFESRDRLMTDKSADPAVKAFVWDTPLLVETGGHVRCDALVFVDVPLEVRLKRVAARGWDAAELARREKLQLPLDKKRLLADYVISNAAEADATREQVCRVFSLILNRD